MGLNGKMVSMPDVGETLTDTQIAYIGWLIDHEYLEVLE